MYFYRIRYFGIDQEPLLPRNKDHNDFAVYAQYTKITRILFRVTSFITVTSGRRLLPRPDPTITYNVFKYIRTCVHLSVWSVTARNYNYIMRKTAGRPRWAAVFGKSYCHTDRMCVHVRRDVATVYALAVILPLCPFS